MSYVVPTTTVCWSSAAAEALRYATFVLVKDAHESKQLSTSGVSATTNRIAVSIEAAEVITADISHGIDHI
jgi:hypothetical protein